MRPGRSGNLVCGALLLASACTVGSGNDNPAATDESSRTGGDTPNVTTTTSPPPPGIWADPTRVGEPYGDTVEGLLTFRGNPSRTYYGEGPAPRAPAEAWRFPDSPMCGQSSEGGEVRTWCGTGWTGQPAVWEQDGRRWLAFGSYDKGVHVLDARMGTRLLPDFPTGDIIKGSVTIDPDGYPLLYTGSRDNQYRVIALDRDEPVELYALDARAVGPTLWNDDWDGAGLVLDDHLVIGGENSRFHVVALHRGYDEAGRVTVAPELVFHTAGWDDELLAQLPDRKVSIENSVAMHGHTAYFSNSGGLVQGWDLSPLARGGTPERTFRYWVGDDVDASVVVDERGMLYVGVEWERHTERARDVGQIVKLDPSRPEPLVWSIADQGSATAGVWATPALHRDLVIVATHGGRILGIDRETGTIRWEKRLPGPTWQSPVVVDDVLVQGDCAGVLHGYDVSDTSVDPPELWRVTLGGCIESTPAVWKGWIFVGTRGGYMHALHDP